MALPTFGGHASGASFLELNEALATARDALLRFADTERVLDTLVCDPGQADCRFPDVAAVRRSVTVDELLRLIAGIPENGEVGNGQANGLYPTLLELAEVFDLLIDQHSLVYGDAIALAEAMQAGWHAMAGCPAEDSAPGESVGTAERMDANLAAAAPLLHDLQRLSRAKRHELVAGFERVAWLPWRAEARFLAGHTVRCCLLEAGPGLPPQLLEPIQAAVALADGSPGEPSPSSLFNRAVGDLLLAWLVRGIASEIVVEALQEPVQGVVPGS